MFRAASLPLLACALATGLLAGDDDVVFHSDVSLVRVDAQVVDSGNRAITHLHAGDFILRQDGKVVTIRSFASGTSERLVNGKPRDISSTRPSMAGSR